MSGVLVPDDETMIEDAPLHPSPANGGPRPEVLVWHLRVIGILVLLLAFTFWLLLLAWRRFWPVLKRIHNAAVDMPESPTTRGLRERLDRKKKR
jgi:hypothetical protein